MSAAEEIIELITENVKNIIYDKKVKTFIRPWAVKHSLVCSERDIEFKNVQNDIKKDDEFIMMVNDTANYENIAPIIDTLAPNCKNNEEVNARVFDNRKMQKTDKQSVISDEMNHDNARGNNKHRTIR